MIFFVVGMKLLSIVLIYFVVKLFHVEIYFDEYTLQDIYL